MDGNRQPQMEPFANALGRMSWRKRAGGVRVLCATTAITLPAQTLTTLARFNFGDGGTPQRGAGPGHGRLPVRDDVCSSGQVRRVCGFHASIFSSTWGLVPSRLAEPDVTRHGSPSGRLPVRAMETHRRPPDRRVACGRRRRLSARRNPLISTARRDRPRGLSSASQQRWLAQPARPVGPPAFRGRS